MPTRNHVGARDSEREQGVRTALNIRYKATQKGMQKLELFAYYLLYITYYIIFNIQRILMYHPGVVLLLSFILVLDANLYH